IWLAMVPEGVKTAASLPVSSAKRASRRATVGSSPNPSSPTSASAMARRISGVGLVTVSLRRSTAGGAGTAPPGNAGVGAIGGTVPSPAVTVRTPPPPPAADPAALVELATDVALRAARLRVGRVGRARATVETKSSATDMVSEMDRAAEHLIVDALLGARPDDGIVAEEGSSRPGTSGVRWVVDPLDGTTNYLYGLPGWAVSIAAEDDGGVVAGVVVDGVQGEVFSATRGGGARLDGEPITCSAKDDPATALVGTGFGYDPRRRAAQGAVVAELLPRVRDIRRRGAAS